MVRLYDSIVKNPLSPLFFDMSQYHVEFHADRFSHFVSDEKIML